MTLSEIKAMHEFGNLEPRLRSRVSVYCRETGELLRDHYNCDLNNIVTKETNDYFITKKLVKVVSSCGYIESIGGWVC